MFSKAASAGLIASLALAAAGCGSDVDNSTMASTTVATPIPSGTQAASTPKATPTIALSPVPTAKPRPTATAKPKPSPTAAPTPKPVTGGTPLPVAADPSGQLKFTTTTLTAKAGVISVDFDNESNVPHNVAIRKGSGAPLVQTKTVIGESTKSSVKLKPGTYEYYCTVPGHEEAGMKGTLTVK